MAVEELIHAGKFPRRYVTITKASVLLGVFATVKAPFRPEESIGVLTHLLAHAWVVLQKCAQVRMFLHKLPVIDQRRILAQLLCDLRMAVEELIHAGKFPTRYVTITKASVLLGVFATVKAPFRPEESIGVLTHLLAHAWVVLQKCAQVRMFLHKLPVIDQRRILAQLLCDLRMAVEELIHAGEFPTGDVAITKAAVLLGVFATVKAPSRPEERIGVLTHLLAHAWVVLQKCAQVRMFLHKLPVIDQRRILAQLLCDLRMAVEELIHAGEFP